MPTASSSRRVEVALLAATAACSLVAWGIALRAGDGGPWPGLGVRIAWAGLLLYAPLRLGVWSLRREVSRAAPASGDRRALGVVLLVGAGLLVWGIDWGLAADLWAPDELRPDLVHEAIRQGLGNGWHDKYPLLHYAVLALPLSAFEAATALGVPAPDGLVLFASELLLMRFLSVAFGLGALVAAYLCGVELVGPRRALFGVVALLLTPLTLFYGKLANLDVPALCWFGFAIFFLLRILRRPSRGAYVGLGMAAAAAVATKDQFYANLALLPLAVLVETARRTATGPLPARLVRALGHPHVVAGGAASVLTFLVLSNAPFNVRGFVSHFALLITLGDLAIVPRTIGGMAELTALTAALFRLALGWPLLLAATAGILSAAWRPERRWWLWLLLVPLGFHLTFTLVTLYVNDRYLIGGVFVLALFAGTALADLAALVRAPRVGRTLAAGVVVASLLYASSINVMMQMDARRTARTWLAARAAPDARVGRVGWYLPYLPPPIDLVDLGESVQAVRDAVPEWILVNARFADRYRMARASGGREVLAALDDGTLGYDEVFRLRTELPWWALLQYHPAFRQVGESPLTNLDKVNPETVIYRRRDGS